MSEKTRIQFDLTAIQLTQLDTLTKGAGCHNRNEFLRKMMSLMAMHLLQEKNGNKPGYLSPEGTFMELVIL